MSLAISSLTAQVQHNCHITDARHGTDFGLCTYLMKMREYYRWEKQLGYGERLDKDVVGDWLSEREQLWDDLADEDFRPIEFSGHTFDPFDADGLNRRLNEFGLMYSAGLVHGGRAQFFLTELADREPGEDGFELWVGRRELARGLYAPPAMTRGKAIFLRRDSLKQLLWEKYESWLWSRPDNAMGRALACYPFERDVEQALEQMTVAEMVVVRAHEIGEFQVGEQLGGAWEELLARVLGTPAELMLRAVRDHWADCLQTLPMLLDREDGDASLHTFMGNQGNMRKDIFPALLQGYESWRASGDPGVLRELATRGAVHWGEVAVQALQLGRDRPADLAAGLAGLVESNRL